MPRGQYARKVTREIKPQPAHARFYPQIYVPETVALLETSKFQKETTLVICKLAFSASSRRNCAGSGFQFLTLMKGDPTHDAEWQPTKDFVEKNGTMNEVFLDYIKKNDLLKTFGTHEIMFSRSKTEWRLE